MVELLCMEISTYRYFDTQMRKDLDDSRYICKLVCNTSLYEDITYVCFKICCLVCKPPSNISWQLANVNLIGSLSRFVDQWLNSFVWRPQPCGIDTQMRKNFDNFRYTWKLVCDTFLYKDITYVCSKKYWLGLMSVFFLSNDSLIWIFETLVFVCQ